MKAGHALSSRWWRPEARHAGWWIAAALWLAFNLALLWIYYHPGQKPLVGDEFDYQRRALALLAGTPMPELYIWPPGQTWYLAAIYAVVGERLLVVQILQAALLALCGWMLMRVWSRLDSARAGRLAMAVLLLNPATLAYAQWLWPEVTHLACLLGACCLLLGDGPRHSVRAFLAGLLLGLALLFKSLLVGLWPLALLRFVRREPGRIAIAWWPALLLGAGMLLATGPALWRGHVETGRAMIADSSLYNLHVGLLDHSRSDYINEAGLPALTAFIDSAPLPQQRNAIYRDKILALVEERGFWSVLGEQLGTQYFRLFNAKTLLASQLPGPACRGHLGAYGPSPMASAFGVLSPIAHSLTLVLFAFGLALWRDWRRPLALLVAVYLAYQLGLYLGLHVMERYLFQMLPVLCGFAGSLLARLTARGDGALAVTPLRLAAGAVLAIGLLALAWLGPLLDGNCL